MKNLWANKRLTLNDPPDGSELCRLLREGSAVGKTVQVGLEDGSLCWLPPFRFYNVTVLQSTPKRVTLDGNIVDVSTLIGEAILVPNENLETRRLYPEQYYEEPCAFSAVCRLHSDRGAFSLGEYPSAFAGRDDRDNPRLIPLSDTPFMPARLNWLSEKEIKTIGDLLQQWPELKREDEPKILSTLRMEVRDVLALYGLPLPD